MAQEIRQSPTPELPREYVSPIVLHEKEEKEISKKEGRIVGCIFWLAIIFVVVLVCLAVYFTVTTYMPKRDVNNGGDNTQITPTQTGSLLNDYSTIQFNDSYTQRAIPVEVTAKSRPQIDLLNLILNKAVEVEWDGDLLSAPNFDYKSLDQAWLEKFINDYNLEQQKAQIPIDLLDDFVNIKGKIDVNEYISEARINYFEALTTFGVQQKYIEEINGNALPDLPGRISYNTDNFINNSISESTIIPIDNDYTRLSVKISPHDVYQMYLSLKQTIMGRKLSNGDLIKASYKGVVFKELGYVLMQAYINLHVPASIYDQGKEEMWMYCDIDFLKPSKSYFWAWPYNKRISDARVATGFMLKAFKMTYKLNDEQYSDLIDVLIGQDNTNMNTMFSIGEKMHEQYNVTLKTGWMKFSNYIYKNIFVDANYQSNQVNRESLKQMLNLLEQFPRYLGEFNPAEDKDLLFFRS